MLDETDELGQTMWVTSSFCQSELIDAPANLMKFFTISYSGPTKILFSVAQSILFDEDEVSEKELQATYTTRPRNMDVNNSLSSKLNSSECEFSIISSNRSSSVGGISEII